MAAASLWAVTAGLAGFPAPALGTAPPGGWAEGRILVQPRAGVTEADLERVLRRHLGRSAQRLHGLGTRVVEVPARFEAVVAEALSRDPRVAFAEPDFRYRLQQFPDDPRYPSQWHLPRIEAPEAWTTSLGEGVVVAVLDTGVDGNHPDLAGRLLPGWNFCDGDEDTNDVHGHGTQVAGVVAAQGDNAVGVASVAWRASILPARVGYADGTAFSSTIASALGWAADQGAQVANISYDIVGSRAIAAAAGRFRSRGGIVVAAAGNTGAAVEAPSEPNFISVSATTSRDTRANWSSYGPHVDLSAPGADILTTEIGGGYAVVSGTSFASPCVAGVAALVLAANPALASPEVESILFGTSLDLGSGGWDEEYGHGRVNAAAAVRAAVGEAGGDDREPEVAFASPADGEEVSGGVGVDVHASDDTGVAFVELYVDGSPHGVSEQEPHGFFVDFSDRPPGPAELTAYAYDSAGNRSSPARITVQVTVARLLGEGEGVGTGDPPQADAAISGGGGGGGCFLSTLSGK
ncbi:MAG: S8 family serine peptidase [Deferrisomatales bacterium]|nr:S8 family serine peptidase [Deferrisomatales bacterium]